MPAQDIKETSSFDSGNPGERERVFRLEAERASLEERLGNKLLELAEQRRRAEHVRVAWLKRFGKLLLALEEGTARVEILRKRSELAELFDDLDEEAAGSRSEIEVRRVTELDQFATVRSIFHEVFGAMPALSLEEEVARAPHVRPWKSEGGRVDTGELEAYRAQIKEILIDLWLLLHPDKLEGNPRYQALDEELKDELQGIRKRTPSPRTAELCFAPSQVGFDLPNLATLIADLRRARSILSAAGIETDDCSDEPEEAASVKIERLEREISLLKNALRDATAELLTLYEDEELQYMKHEIASPEIHEEIERRLQVRIDELHHEASSLQEDLDYRFRGGER